MNLEVAGVGFYMASVCIYMGAFFAHDPKAKSETYKLMGFGSFLAAVGTLLIAVVRMP